MSIIERALENFRLKYLKILSDSNDRIYSRKNNNFEKFLIYSIFSFILTITNLVILDHYVNNPHLISNDLVLSINNFNNNDLSNNSSLNCTFLYNYYTSTNKNGNFNLIDYTKIQNANMTLFENITLNNFSGSSAKSDITSLNNITNLIFIQSGIILFQFLLLVSFILFKFIEIRLKSLLFRLISFTNGFNNFLQFQVLTLIFSKLNYNEFHSRVTIPYFQSTIIIFYTIFMDSDFITTLLSSLVSCAIIFIFSIGNDWFSNQKFIVGLGLIISYIYFTFKVEIDKRNLFLIHQNNKNNLKNIMNTLENLHSGIIVYGKNESFEYNKKFIEIFKHNIELMGKVNYQLDYLKFIIFTNLTEFNPNLDKKFLKKMKKFHLKFIEFELIIKDLIATIEDYNKLEQSVLLDKFMNKESENDEAHNAENDKIIPYMAEDKNYHIKHENTNHNHNNQNSSFEININLKRNFTEYLNNKNNNTNNFKISEGNLDENETENQNCSNLILVNNSVKPAKEDENKHCINKNETNSNFNNIIDENNTNSVNKDFESNGMKFSKNNENIPISDYFNNKIKNKSICFDNSYATLLDQKEKDNKLNIVVDTKNDNNPKIQFNANNFSIDHYSISSGDLKEIIKKKTLFNSTIINNNATSKFNIQNNVSNHQLNKSSINGIEKGDDNSNLIIINNNEISMNNSQLIINANKPEERSIEINKKEENSQQEHEKQATNIKTQKSLYYRLKEDDIKVSKAAELYKLKEKIKHLKEKLKDLNTEFINFKTFFFNNANSSKFIYLATKKFRLNSQEVILKIYFRYNDSSECLEFLIDDISAVIKMEDINYQFRCRKYFLDKFSHEFRNPILNIKQLVKNIKTYYKEFKDYFKRQLSEFRNFDVSALDNENYLTFMKNNNLSSNRFMNFYLNQNFTNNNNIQQILEESKSCKSLEIQTTRKSAFLNADNIPSFKITNNKNKNHSDNEKDKIINRSESHTKRKSRFNNYTVIIKNTGDFLKKTQLINNSNNNNMSNMMVTDDEKDLQKNKISNIETKSIESLNVKNNNISDLEKCIIGNKLDPNYQSIIMQKRNQNHLKNKKTDSTFNSKDLKNTLVKRNKDMNKLASIPNSLKDTFFINNSEDIRGKIINLQKKKTNLTILKKLNINYNSTEIFSELRHIKNVCEYMSLLISDFDFISRHDEMGLSRDKSFTSKNTSTYNENVFSPKRNLNNRNPNNKMNVGINSVRLDGNNNKNSRSGDFSSNNQLSNKETFIEKSYFDIRKFMNYFIKIFGSKIFLSDKHINLEFSIDPKVPEKINHDQDKIKLILFNLLSNSVKFTSNGLIKIEVETDNQNLMFSIIDSGIGIKDENINLLLQPMSSINLAENFCNQGGIGMGLYVARKYIESLGGKLNIESNYGVGTLIEIKIPFAITRSNTNYTLLVNEKVALDNKFYYYYYDASPDRIDLRYKPLKYRSFKPRIDTRIKEKFEIKSISDYDKSHTGFNQHIELVSGKVQIIANKKQLNNKKKLYNNTLSYTKLGNKSGFVNLNYNQNFKNLKTNKNIININNNFYNSNNNFTINTELYNTNVFRPHKYFYSEDLKNSVLNNPNATNIMMSPPNSTVIKNLLPNETKTIVISENDLKYHFNYNNLKGVKNNNFNIQENISVSENNFSPNYSHECYSHDDLQATLLMDHIPSSFNLNQFNFQDNGNIYTINHTSSNMQSSSNNFLINLNKKKSSSNLNTYSIVYKKSNNNLMNNIINSNRNYNNNLNNLNSLSSSNFNGDKNTVSNLNINNFGKKHKSIHGKVSQQHLNNFVSFKNSIRILLVDDERLIRQSEKNVINKYFKKKGISYEIEECTDGVECLFKIYEGLKNGKKYDLIITDETMNFMKGSTTTEILRNLMTENVMYFLKIVMVTSYEISNISLNIKKNLDKIFTKPLSVNMLDIIFSN